VKKIDNKMQENYVYSQLFRLESIDEPEQIDEVLSYKMIILQS